MFNGFDVSFLCLLFSEPRTPPPPPPRGIASDTHAPRTARTQRISDLLHTTDITILLATLRLALRLAPQYSSYNSSLSWIPFSEKRLLSLAQPWGTRENGIDLMEIAQAWTARGPARTARAGVAVLPQGGQGDHGCRRRHERRQAQVGELYDGSRGGRSDRFHEGGSVNAGAPSTNRLLRAAPPDPDSRDRAFELGPSSQHPEHPRGRYHFEQRQSARGSHDPPPAKLADVDQVDGRHPARLDRGAPSPRGGPPRPLAAHPHRPGAVLHGFDRAAPPPDRSLARPRGLCARSMRAKSSSTSRTSSPRSSSSSIPRRTSPSRSRASRCTRSRRLRTTRARRPRSRVRSTPASATES